MLVRLPLAAAIAVLAFAGAAHAQSNQPVSAQSLANCAGAIAAAGDINIITYAGGGDAALDAILARMNREPGVEGMTGRYAASAARSFWSEQPRAERDAAVAECRARFAAE